MSNERRDVQKTKVIEKMPNSKYYSYLVRFGEIYTEMLGMNYFPGVRDLNYIRGVVLVLNSNVLGFDDYVRWICRTWRFQIKKMGTIALRRYLNEYIAQKKRGGL